MPRKPNPPRKPDPTMYVSIESLSTGLEIREKYVGDDFSDENIPVAPDTRPPRKVITPNEYHRILSQQRIQQDARKAKIEAQRRQIARMMFGPEIDRPKPKPKAGPFKRRF